MMRRDWKLGLTAALALCCLTSSGCDFQELLDLFASVVPGVPQGSPVLGPSNSGNPGGWGEPVGGVFRPGSFQNLPRVPSPGSYAQPGYTAFPGSSPPPGYSTTPGYTDLVNSTQAEPADPYAPRRVVPVRIEHGPATNVYPAPREGGNLAGDGPRKTPLPVGSPSTSLNPTELVSADPNPVALPATAADPAGSSVPAGASDPAGAADPVTPETRPEPLAGDPTPTEVELQPIEYPAEPERREELLVNYTPPTNLMDGLQLDGDYPGVTNFT